MVDSSFILSPVSAEFSDVWSKPELLSAKGHNAIYIATRFGRRYILKALAEPYRESTPHIELLRKEFSIGVGVDHPNIVRLLDFGYMESIGWYIQMEFIDGITLEQFLETKPSVAVRRRLLNQLLDALSFLHERQIIHRDIKPSNILITRNGSSVKLIDFGVSDTDDYAIFKQPAGSMAYIAPEQLRGEAIDNRADIYAIGRIIQLVFPHRYRCIARRCTRVAPARRYSSCVRVARAIRNADRLRIGLPVALCLSLLLCAAAWNLYSRYRQTEQTHMEYEQALSSDIDSLRAQNNLRQHSVDSLNRIVDSLAAQMATPSPQAVLKEKCRQLYAEYIHSVRKAVEANDLSIVLNVPVTPKDRFYNNWQKISDSIKDEELTGAFNRYTRMYYDSMYVPFEEKIRDEVSALVRSDSDYINLYLWPL